MSRITFDSPDEVEKFHAQESWVPVVLGGIPVLLVCVAVCALLVFAFHLEQYVPWMVVGTIVVVLASRIPHIIDNWQTDVVVTDRRLYYRHGIFDVADHVTDLGSITDVTVDPTIAGRMFNYANVRIQTKAGDDDFVLKEIKDAYKMRQVINTGRDELEQASQPPAQGVPRR
jgi:uncharacterized membrane protein YdbT with pleckstrin-like domain